MSNYTETLNAAPKTISIVAKSFVLDRVGETFRGILVGFTTWHKRNVKTGQITPVKVAQLFDGVELRFNMGAQLVRELGRLPIGVAVEIKLVELRRNTEGEGKTKIYDVVPLATPLADPADIFGGTFQIAAPVEHAPARISAPEQAAALTALYGEA